MNGLKNFPRGSDDSVLHNRGLWGNMNKRSDKKAVRCSSCLCHIKIIISVEQHDKLSKQHHIVRKQWLSWGVGIEGAKFTVKQQVLHFAFQTNDKVHKHKAFWQVSLVKHCVLINWNGNWVFTSAKHQPFSVLRSGEASRCVNSGHEWLYYKCSLNLASLDADYLC